jgi:hypothetical protein
LGLGVVQANRQSVESDKSNFTLQMWGRIGEIKSVGDFGMNVYFCTTYNYLNSAE